MLRCAWLPVIAHHLRRRLRHVGHAVRHFLHHHRAAYRWVCVVVGGAGVGGTGLGAGWGIGRGLATWWPGPTAGLASVGAGRVSGAGAQLADAVRHTARCRLRHCVEARVSDPTPRNRA